MEPSRSLSISLLGNTQLCKLFVGGLSPNTDEAGLRGHFEAFGSLTNCVVMMNPETNRSRCFGFITFSNANEADRAMAASPHVLDGCPVELKRALSREDSCKPGAHAQVKKIFVGGLKGDVGERDLVRHFSQFGPVERVEIIINKQSGKKRGFGFVHFVDYDSADKAAVVKFHPIQGHRVEVKKALPRDNQDPWGLDLPTPGSSSTWRLSNQAHAGLSNSPSSDPSFKPNVDPSPTPSPTSILNPILKPAGWSGPKPAGWSGPKLAAWLGPKLAGWPGPKPPVWSGPKPPENPDAKPSGGPDLKPDGDSDPKFDGSLIPPLAWIPCPKTAWIPCPKPAWFPSPAYGWVPNQKSGWGPDPKPMEGPNPKPVGGLTPKPTGETWVPEAKPGTDPASNPVLTSKFGPSLGPGLGPKIGPVLNLGYGPKPEPNSNSGLDPKWGGSLNRGFTPKSVLGPNPKPGLLGPGPSPKPGLLGPGPALGQGSGPRHHNVSRGNRDQNGRGGNSNQCGVCGARSENQTSYSHSQYRGDFGPMKRRWGGWANRGGSSRGTHRGGAAGSGGN